MLIAIEGCVGVGKTTVAEGLARHRGSAILLEDFESNPFLKSFYKDPSGNALEVEFTFLLLHSHQLRTTVSRYGDGAFEVIADFHLWKDLIYAKLNLADTRILDLFDQLHGVLAERTPQPSLMVMLTASTDLILDRIARRRREYEQQIDPDYFKRLNDAYMSAFDQYTDSKLCLSMDRWDFVASPSLFGDLSSLIDREIVR